MSVSTSKRDFLTLTDVNPEEARALFQRAAMMKANRRAGRHEPTLVGRTLAMIFEKSSTRTRVSFEAGMFQMGGTALFLSHRDLQIGRGEPLKDSARVLSRYVDAIMIRTFSHEVVETLARHASIPIINGLTDDFHPCQVMADVFTYEERCGSIQGRRVAWIGDGNNMANTWIQAAALFQFHLVLACPDGYEPNAAVVARARAAIAQAGATAQASVQVVRAPAEAAKGAHLVTTDVWTSMGQEQEQQRREKAFVGYCVDQALMDLAADKAIFMHCLPAHRDEEVTDDVLEGPASVVWDEAENRLYVQNAILEWLILRR